MYFNKVAKYCGLINIFIVASLIELRATTSSISDTSAINSILREARVALDTNNIPEAFRLSLSAYDKSNGSDYIYGKAKSLAYIGSIQFIKGSRDSSLINYKKAYLLFKQENNQVEVGHMLDRIGNVYRNIGKQDSAEFYYNKALDVSKQVNNRIEIANVTINLGSLYESKGDFAKALECQFSALSLREEVGDKAGQSSSLNHIGIVFWDQGNFAKAIEFFYKSMKICEDLNDKGGIAMLSNNIGLVYQQSGDYKQALTYHALSLNIKQSLGDSLGMSFSYMNLGGLYQKQRDYPKAFDYYQKAEKIKVRLSNLSDLAYLYNSMGVLYRDMIDYDKSLKKLRESEEIYKKINEPKGIANSLIQLGVTYLELGYKKNAIDSCLLGMTIAKRIGSLDLVKEGYGYLYKMYERVGNLTQAYGSFKLFIALRDSINNIEKSKQIAQTQLQAEFDKLMQKQKVEQAQELAIVKGKSHQQTVIANIFIFAFVLTLAVFVLLFIDFRQKQRNNDLLAFQKLDTERQKTELMAQRDELEIQKNLVVHQRDRIMTMLTDLGESIDYARKIQQAMLPSDRALEKILGNYFLLFKPRESVGGDFYWVAQDETLTFFAIADCTGHGVPGGFMSMLGVSLLNELNTRPDCDSPSKILWDLRDLIIKALNQTGLDEDSQDGMDIALCMYNSQNHHLVYSGANLSIIIATSNPPQAGERVVVQDNIVELKPDRMPVAYYQRMEKFYEHHVVLNPGDSIYLFSDGYADQFGGPLNKKYGYISFKNLIARMAKNPFEKQRDILWNEFDRWIGEENQTDDVIVMGIRIT